MIISIFRNHLKVDEQIIAGGDVIIEVDRKEVYNSEVKDES